MLRLLYLSTIVSVVPAVGEEAGKLWRKEETLLEVLVGAECPVKQFAPLRLPEVCHDEVCLGLGLLWTCVFVGTLYHDACVLPGYCNLNPWILLQRHPQSKESVCFLMLCCCKTMFFLIISETVLIICRMIAGSGINVNSTVNGLTLCTALQGTEINPVFCQFWEEPSFNCIFGLYLRGFLSPKYKFWCASGLKELWVMQLPGGADECICIWSCDAAELLTLNTELLRCWCCFFPSFSSPCRKRKFYIWLRNGGREWNGGKRDKSPSRTVQSESSLF